MTFFILIHPKFLVLGYKFQCFSHFFQLSKNREGNCLKISISTHFFHTFFFPKIGVATASRFWFLTIFFQSNFFFPKIRSRSPYVPGSRPKSFVYTCRPICEKMLLNSATWFLGSITTLKSVPRIRIFYFTRIYNSLQWLLLQDFSCATGVVKVSPLIVPQTGLLRATNTIHFAFCLWPNHDLWWPFYQRQWLL